MLPVLVLSAGLGTRLDPLTRLLAKPAVPVAGRTLIERVLDWLRRQGVRDVVINLHHRPDTMTAIVGDGAHLGLRARYSWEASPLGSAGGPRRALPLLPGTFVIANGDTLCEMDLPAMVAAHERRGAAVTLAVVPNRSPERYNGLVADAEQRVCGFAPKGQAQGTWHFVGIQVVSAGVFEPLEDGVPRETVAGIYRERVADGKRDIHVYPVNARFVDVGTPRDYLDAVRLYDAEQPHPGGIVTDGSRAFGTEPAVRRSVIWAGSVIEPGADLDECIVAGVRVPASVTARRATLVPASVVRPGESVEIVGDMAMFPFGR